MSNTKLIAKSNQSAKAQKRTIPQAMREIDAALKPTESQRNIPEGTIFSGEGKSNFPMGKRADKKDI